MEDAGIKDFKRVFFIIIDALRENFFSPEIMPYTHRLADRGVWFRNAYSVTNATDPSLTSMYTGMYPLNHGLIHHGKLVSPSEVRLLESTRFLQEALRERGWRTLAVDFLERWHRRGYSAYLVPWPYPVKKGNPVYRFANRVLPSRVKKSMLPILEFLGLRRGKRWLQGKPYDAFTAIRALLKFLGSVRSGERIFAFIHLWDTHTPYTAPPELVEIFLSRWRGDVYDLPLVEALKSLRGPWKESLLTMFNPRATVGEIVSLYAAAARYVDNALKHLIDRLEEKGLLEDSLIIVTSDHGESLTEHGIWFDHHGLYEVSIRVPLIMYSPLLEKKTIDAWVQHIDVTETLWCLLIGGPRTRRNHSTSDGECLINLLSGKGRGRSFIYAEEAYTQRKFMIRIDRYKYIFAPNREKAICRYCGVVHGGGLEELYDLKRDPEEKNNIIDENRDIASELRKELKEFIQNLLRKRLKRKIKNRE